MADIINSLQTAADAYISTPNDDPTKGQLFEAVEEWLIASYELDGYPEDDLGTMDFTSIAHDYINRRRALNFPA